MSNPRRCLLFVPGARPERFAKALASRADQVCIDLEDAVGPNDKASAREAALDFILSASNNTDKMNELGLRINNITTKLGQTDLQRIVERNARPAFVMLPKIENAADVLLAEKILADTDIALIALLESPHAVFESRNIAAASKRVQALMFGGFDYAVAARVKPNEQGWMWPRAQIAAAAAEAGIGAIDAPMIDVDNIVGVTRETELVIGLGFTAKSAIHPAQVAAIQNAFLPTVDEFARATRVLDALAHSTSMAIQVDGKMVDRPIEMAAQRVAALAKSGLRQ